MTSEFGKDLNENRKKFELKFKKEILGDNNG
jgi:hypothetical protein